MLTLSAVLYGRVSVLRVSVFSAPFNLTKLVGCAPRPLQAFVVMSLVLELTRVR
eukprot:m.78829 g.78829  ORF g.78829 m.78829 type:complete len:54 (-) comp10749_c1_seq1:51-212(-)